MTHTKDDSINPGVTEMILPASPEGSVREGCRRQAESENGDDWKSIRCSELQLFTPDFHTPVEMAPHVVTTHLSLWLLHCSVFIWMQDKYKEVGHPRDLDVFVFFSLDSPSALVVVLAFPCQAFLLPKLHFPPFHYFALSFTSVSITSRLLSACIRAPLSNETTAMPA